MMYSEFVNGTGCKENEHNYNVFLQLEKLYMDSNIAKEDVYEFGKKLVDNSKSREEIEFEENIKKEIKKLEDERAYHEREVKHYESLLEVEDDAEWAKKWKSDIKRNKEWAKDANRKIKELKWVLA